MNKQECKLIDKKYICIRFNKEVHIINSENFIKYYKVMSGLLIYKLILLGRKDRLIVLYELGLTCISLNGIKLCEHSTDMINEYKIENDSIELITDKYNINILKNTGNIISKI